MAEAGPGGGAAATGVGVEAAEAPVARAGAAGAWLAVAAVPDRWLPRDARGERG